MGIATFERVYHLMSSITGVPFTNSAVTLVYQSSQQSMPSQPQINAFLGSHQTAISQMANAYCTQLVNTPALFTAFFVTNQPSSSLSQSFNASASSYFGTTTAPGPTANSASVVTPLVNAIVGTSAYPLASLAMTQELNTLLLRIPTLNASASVSTATIAACTAALGSAAATVQ